MSEVDEYLATLPADRRDAIARVRDVINENISSGFEEKLQYGMIAWCVPESVLPASEVYNKQPLCFTALGSQKSHMAVYMMGIYGDEAHRAWFEKAYKDSGKKPDIGKSCVRFKTLDALPLDVIGEAVSRIPVEKFVAGYHASREQTAEGRAKTAAAERAKDDRVKAKGAKATAAEAAKTDRRAAILAASSKSTGKPAPASAKTAKAAPAKKTAAKSKPRK